MKTKIYFNSIDWFILLFLITISSLLIRYEIMTEKFFYDSTELLRLEKSALFYDGGFGVTAQFFHCLNVFDIATLFEWSCYISIIYFFINLWILKDIKVVSLDRLVFLILSIFFIILICSGNNQRSFTGDILFSDLLLLY